MKKILGLFIFISLITVAQAQRGEVFFDLNYNTFSHSSLKDLQEEQLKGVSDYPMEVNNDFSSNIGFTLGYKIDSQFAAYFSYNTTGGKISYADYSGIIQLTQPVKQYVLGGMYTFPMSENNENFRFGFKAFVSYSTLELKSYSKLLDTENKESIDLFSNDFGLGPIMIYEQPIWLVKLRFSIAYDIVFTGKLKLKDNDELHLEDGSGDEVRAGWSGLRFGFGLAVPI